VKKQETWMSYATRFKLFRWPLKAAHGLMGYAKTCTTY
jgi:hypothetical protein